MPERTCAVVVTFNRQATLRKCLLALRAQSRPLDEIVVVDNASTDGTLAMVAAEFPEAIVVTLPENLGASGGFHHGVKAARARGADRLWIMDDDAYPYPDALAALLEAEREVKGEKRPVLVCRQVQGSDAPRGDAVVRPIEHAMFVGMLVPREAIDAIGWPREEYFIYCDDTDYTRRLRHAGFSVVEVGQSRIDHADWSSLPTKTRRVLGRTVVRPVFPDWKAYYLFRNQILVDRLARPEKPAIRWLIAVGAPRESFCYAVLGQPRKAWFIARGVIDGLLMRKGKRVRPGSKWG